MATVVVGLLTALGAAPARADVLPPVRHAFLIVLENADYDTSFGPSSGLTSLNKELVPRGQLLRQYFGTSHESLGNYITLISGQAPNPDTQGDCNLGFRDVAPGVMGADGQAMGSGCVYPAAAKTIADQLDAKGLSWKGYMQDMGADPTREPATCGHPALNSQDKTQSATAKDQYATRHDPFVYFHSIIDDQKRCDAHVVNLDALTGDLGSAASTPSFSLITPDLCSDGHDASCADGGPGGQKAVDLFLRQWVPRITGSPAFADGGLLVITWDESEGPQTESDACCDEPTGPNTPAPGITGPGGGRVGAVVLSPFVAPGSVNDTPYNHYSLLRSFEDLFGLTHLGYAGQSGLKAFGADVFGAAPTVDLTGPSSSTSSCRLRPLGSRRSLAAGTLVSALRIQRRKGRRPVLLVTTSRRTRTYVHESGRRRAHALHTRTCSAARITLARSHGRARVMATVRRHVETRTVVY
jgi:phosphatidylinositol-3-phosphatase